MKQYTQIKTRPKITRKLLRGVMRHNLEKANYPKLSRALHTLWDKYQIKRVGAAARLRHQAMSTHLRKQWVMRIAALVSDGAENRKA